MKMCIKFAHWMAILFLKVAIVLVLLGVIGFLMFVINRSILFNVANYWNYLVASIPFALLAISCIGFVLAAKEKQT